MNNPTPCEHRQIVSDPLSFLQSSMSRCQVGTIYHEEDPTLGCFSPPGYSLAGFRLRFSMKVLHCFLLSLLLWPDGSIPFSSRKSMSRQSKGDSSHGVVPDALVYSRGVRDIYWQKFNGLGENFPKRYIFGGWWWQKCVSVCSPNKRNILALALFFLGLHSFLKIQEGFYNPSMCTLQGCNILVNLLSLRKLKIGTQICKFAPYLSFILLNLGNNCIELK